ncbi:MAG: PQQ-binding-like beta-propeller repeat protein [Bacteroidales bacterium]
MSKKIIFLIFSFFWCSLISFCQQNKVIPTEKIIGTNHVTKNEIKAKEFLFTKRVHDFYIDSINNYAIIQFRNTERDDESIDNEGSVILFDLNDSSIKWENKFDFSDENLYFNDSLIINYTSNKMYLWDLSSGENIWEANNSLYYLFKDQKIALAYNSSWGKSSNKLEGIDIKSGEKVWERKISTDDGWDNIYSINDSIVIIYSNGFHTLNLNDGKGIDFVSKTNYKNYTYLILTNALGITLGILTGVFTYTYDEPIVTSDIQSKILIDSSYLFYASRHNLYKLNQDGTIVWNKKLNKKKISNSTLFKKDSIVYMINNGYAIKNGVKVNYGTTSLTAYNTYSGNQIFYSPFVDKKKKDDMILDYKVEKDEIVFLFKKSIARYSLIDGKFISDRNFNIKEYGDMVSFIEDNIYHKDNLYYSKITKTYPKNYNIFTNFGLALSLNEKFETQALLEYKDLYFLSLRAKTYEILTNDSLISIINNNGKTITELTLLKDVVIIRDKLFGKKENSLFMFDLNEE